MRAICIAVGSELLLKDRIDTNSLYIARRLREHGILMDMKWVVGDDGENLRWTVKNACRRSQLVVITGGLGPTEDDITREAVANVFKRELIFREDIVEEIRQIFHKRGIRMPEINTRQAFVIEGAEVLSNPVGTAPGQYLREKDCHILLLPGPPAEMNPMFDDVLHKKIAPLSNYRVHARTMAFAGITESETDARIADIYSRYPNTRTTILASPGWIEVSLMGRSRKDPSETIRQTDELATKIKTALADHYICEGDLRFEAYILEELHRRHLTLAVAESCTGGGLSDRLIDIPGSSESFLGGVVAYSNELKKTLLRVQASTLNRYGAVSPQTAREMARGIKTLSGSHIGIGITGIAGPGGATQGKPVGLVCIHLSADGHEEAFQKIFGGSRQVVKTRSENYALNMIREYLNSIED